MKQLLQSLRTGAIEIKDVDAPSSPKRSGVLVRVHASVISAGTEKMSVDLARASLIEKAKSRPDDVKRVLADIKRQGFWATYNRVKTKLDSQKPMGYSCTGEVIAVSPDVDDLKPGDRVACGGQGAYHSEVVSVLRNLCVKIPTDVSYSDACYTTLGAIAMHGIRQAELKLGESVLVIGLGLIGQLTAMIARAAGAIVIGIDLDDENIKFASDTVHHAYNRKEDNLLQKIQAITSGNGVDAVIITAAADTNDPIEFAALASRDRGRVVMVGVTKMDIPRETYYRKEIEFRFSRSYGPGRYDHTYEEKGIDYPIGYVRWTERRNMQEFLRLVAERKILPSHLTTHTFSIDYAKNAYDIISGERKEKYLGIVLTYPESEIGPFSQQQLQVSLPTEPSIGFIGAGSFAQGYLLPHLKDTARLVVVANESGSSSEDVRRQFGFSRATTNVDEVISANDVNTIFIATRHDSHADLICRSLEAGKHVFCEKPMSLTADDLMRIAQTYDHARSSGKLVHFLIGYNRRFSPLVRKMKEHFGEPHQPSMMLYRVNAGPLPRSHWTQDDEAGGGRIIGEVCHFVDTAAYFAADSTPVSVSAKHISTGRADSVDADTFSATIEYEDGSVATILYIANGDKNLPKEEIQVYCSGETAIMKNFTTLEIYRGTGKPSVTNGQGKGHQEEVAEFLKAIREGAAETIPIDSMIATSLVTFAIRDSLASGETIRF
jgi:polar amino acid transport system substrate-binding protein